MDYINFIFRLNFVINIEIYDYEDECLIIYQQIIVIN